MDNFFDNLCRVLATPMPRKRVLKIITGGLAGVVLAPFAFGQKKNNNCGTVNCTGSQMCCFEKTGGGPWCCPGGSTCNPNAGGNPAIGCLNSNKKVVSPAKL